MTRRQIPAIHPGYHIAAELEERGVSQAELARALHVPASRVSEIIRGRRSVNADFALRLGRWMGTGPEFWLNLQKTHDPRLAEQQHGSEIATIRPWTDAA
jgi:addiction module HigA family antidote